ncbi:hypothetical protein GCM10009827_010960 [Dactylosporangium maewongense]|uniref:DUF2306 domain-containing protein n=1 Tax=Dactylosporangium maewongense TaxID=634393 RepID=A0ABP4KII3_9ACTN
MTISAMGVAAFSAPAYLTGDAAQSRIPVNPDVAPHYLSIVIHALPASLALFLGPLQFITPLRVKRPGLHRIVGRIYMISIVAATIAATFATIFTLDGVPVQVGFALLIAAWVYTLARGYRTIRRGEVQLHRIWMIRNYSLTFAAVVLRAFLGLGLALQEPYPWITFADIYTSSVWASIVICAVIPEYFIIQRMLTPLARRQQRRQTAATGRPDRAVA